MFRVIHARNLYPAPLSPQGFTPHQHSSIAFHSAIADVTRLKPSQKCEFLQKLRTKKLRVFAFFSQTRECAIANICS